MEPPNSKNSDSEISLLFVEICKRRRNVLNGQMAAAGLYAGQDRLLYHLSCSEGKEGMTVSELAEKICIQPATVSNMIRRMEATGLLVKNGDLHDKRTYRVSLTPKGKKTFQEVAVIWKEVHDETVRGFTESEKHILTALLRKVVKNMG